MIDRQISDIIGQKKKILCYGAGAYGQRVFAYLRSRGAEPSGFIVTEKNGEETLFGKSVRTLSEIDDIESYHIVVTVSGSYRADIISKLEAAEINDYSVMTDEMMDGIRDRILSKNSELKNTFGNNGRCFIMGMGPSLLDHDIRMLKDEIVFSCSFCPLLDDYETVKPLVYVTPALTNDNESREYLYEKAGFLSDTVTSPIVIADYNDLALFESRGLFRDKEVFYISQGGADWSDDRSIFDITKVTPAIQTATVMMLKAAMYIGFSEIILLGTDHSLTVKKKYDHAYNIEKLRNKHDTLYEIMKKHNSRVEDLDDKERKRVMDEIRSEYAHLGAAARKTGTRIFYTSDGGTSEGFEKVDLEQII